MRPLHRLEPAQLNDTWFGATEEKSLGGKLINKDRKLKKKTNQLLVPDACPESLSCD